MKCTSGKLNLLIKPRNGYRKNDDLTCPTAEHKANFRIFSRMTGFSTQNFTPPVSSPSTKNDGGGRNDSDDGVIAFIDIISVFKTRTEDQYIDYDWRNIIETCVK